MKTVKRLTVGILAHVDSGKTTLSEALLYKSGEIREIGRVDHKNTFLDTDTIERERGITIFSKQAMLQFPDAEIHRVGSRLYRGSKTLTASDRCHYLKRGDV